MAQVFSPTYGVIDENDPRYLQELAGAKQKGMTLYATGASAPTAPPPSGPAAAATQYSSPEQAYQATGIAGYGKTFEQLRQASLDRNSEYNALRDANDARIKAMSGGLNLSQDIWGGMDDYALTGALGGLANSPLGRQLQEALIRKYGSQNELNRQINKYWAGGGVGIDRPGFNHDYWQKLGTMSDMGKDISSYLQAGAKQEYNPWTAYGINPVANPYAAGTASIQGGLDKQNGGNPATPPVNNPAPTPQNPPQAGPLASPVNTGFQPTGPGYTFQQNQGGNRNIGLSPLQPPNPGAMTNNQPFNNNSNPFSLNPNQFKLPGQR